MPLKRSYFLLCILLFFASTAAAESTLSFPCDPELSPFLATSEHKITKEIDLNEWHRMEIDYWGDDVTMVESGSLIVLDEQFMIINLRFSKDFDYEAAGMHLPDVIMLANDDLNVSDDTNPPLWCVMMYPDKDDPYSFHYIGTWNQTMFCIRFYGNYVNPHGELVEDFDLHVDI